MTIPVHRSCVECPVCGVRYVLKTARRQVYGNGASIETSRSGHSNYRRLVCSCRHVHPFQLSQARMHAISEVAESRGYDYNIVPTLGVEDYYDGANPADEHINDERINKVA